MIGFVDQQMNVFPHHHKAIHTQSVTAAYSLERLLEDAAAGLVHQ
ncbi:MAG TPA: hypothetical protein VGF88_15545 [Acidobacteriaceae bacterium]|jgi:hypothetical protein